MLMRLCLWLIALFVCGHQAFATDEQVANKTRTIRGLHFVLRSVSLERAYWMVDAAKQSDMNTIIVLLTDGVKLNHSPWKANSDAWTAEEFKTWVSYAQNNGMQVIPELKLLTHQEKFLNDTNPELMFDSTTYDPGNEAVYNKFVYPLMDEIVSLVQPKAFHIGHDEVVGWARKRTLSPNNRVGNLPTNQRMLPADLFYQDVLKLHDYLKAKGIETWMWGDMLISPNEFPTMNKENLHGHESGYGKAMRVILPKDIVICDWHYNEAQPYFPSLKQFKDEGFRVVGSTWRNIRTIENFSHYASHNHAYGMMATTWFHVQRKEWPKVWEIIETSGRAFARDFPDE